MGLCVTEIPAKDIETLQVELLCLFKMGIMLRQNSEFENKILLIHIV
jgi:hypothetical protein